MTVTGTEVLAVDSLGALYRAIVRIGFPRYRGSFLTLKFDEKKPFTGFTQNGRLDLIYHEDPLLRAGQAVSALGDSTNQFRERYRQDAIDHRCIDSGDWSNKLG
jgi:hypothetical protein